MCAPHADGKAIEKKAKTLEKEVVERTANLKAWTKHLRARALVRKTFIFANNHYQGYAPETVELFANILQDPPK